MATTVLSPTAILGYGFPEKSFERGLEAHPDLIAADAGSTDPGPYYLGEGSSFTDGAGVKRDLTYMLVAGRDLDVPVAVGTAGGCGGTVHLNWNLAIARQIAAERNLSFRMAVIDTEVSKELILSKMSRGELVPLGPVQPCTEETIAATTRIVAQIGAEPFMSALQAGADVVIAGRAYDPAVFACLPLLRGESKGLSLHMGKILECAAIAASPGSGSDCMFGTVGRESFIVEPLSPERVCTVTSVAAHTLYEKSDPYLLPGPGGELDLRSTIFEQVSPRRVKVSGTDYRPSSGLWVKLEGARQVGFRTVSISGVRDPIFISQVDDILSGVRRRTADNFRDAKAGSDYILRFVVYGKDGVMGSLEPVSKTESHELGIVVDAVAKSQDLANTICSFARSTLLHYGYPGRKSTAGNLALLYSPSDTKMGPVYEFSVHHLMQIEDYSEVSRLSFEEVKGNATR